MEIISAVPTDEADVKALLQACELPFEDLTPAHLAHFFVVRDGNQIVGTIGLEGCGELGLLRSLAVTESLRGQGLGLRLVEQIEVYARSQNISALYLLTTTADKFFASLGYQVVPRESAPTSLQATPEFQSICPASAICMRKQIKSP